MKFSEKWLREWVDPPVSTAELAHQLTMAGLEVDAIEPVAGAFSKVVVGQVLKVEPHPDADRLRVCEVNVGGEAPLQIVCGAANVREGLKAPVALVGAKLPGGFKIKKSKLRGVASHGMLCSASELGLAEQSEGLMELPDTAPVGADLRDYLELDDVTIELGLTPNRGDCLSIAGVAREVGVLNRVPVVAPEIPPQANAIKDSLEVSLDAPEDCPRYVGRIVRGIDPGAKTPLWMQEKLRRSGLRSLGPVVDVTNYVLLELGQPMHAFDLARIRGGIHVRHAAGGEKLTLLDGQEVTLDEGTLVIADERGPLALAGIMGGAESAVGDVTTDIFLESAWFSPLAIAGRARSYGLHTDSSHRFERGVDPELQLRALERATWLLMEIVGGQAGPVIERVVSDHLPKREPVSLREARIERVLGTPIAAEEVTDTLRRLGMQVEGEGSCWEVTPPSFRFDIAIEVDLIEEVGRIHGYDKLPETTPAVHLRMPQRPEGRVSLGRIRERLVDLGYAEAITYSFVDPALQERLDPAHPAIALANPIASDMAVMRTSLWPGLLQAARYNLNRQQNRLCLFECGLRFIRQDSEIKQEMMVSGVLSGSVAPQQWGIPTRNVDFFDAKGHVEALLELTGRRADFTFTADSHPALHPGQCAAIVLDGHGTVGRVGALHPAQASALGLSQTVYLFELQADILQEGTVPAYRPLSKYPSIRRDIALVVDAEVPAGQILETIRQAGAEHLTNIELFDVYTGEGIDLGRKSLALGLTLQDLSRTLTDTEVEAEVNRILDVLNNKLGATLRA